MKWHHCILPILLLICQSMGNPSCIWFANTRIFVQEKISCKGFNDKDIWLADTRIFVRDKIGCKGFNDKDIWFADTRIFVQDKISCKEFNDKDILHLLHSDLCLCLVFLQLSCFLQKQQWQDG